MSTLVHPKNRSPLTVHQGGLICLESDEIFESNDGIYNLIIPKVLAVKDASVKEFYDRRANAYDENLHMTFKTHNENEQEARESFIAKLKLNKNSKVLDLACGTGRDSEIIADKLSEEGELALVDISKNMLVRCKEKLSAKSVKQTFVLANANALPFPDHYFDAVYSFGGLGEFSDIKGSLAEMVRITKVGGRIVVGDESIPVWLRDTYFAKVLTKTNPQFSANIPFESIPVEARQFNLSYVIGGVFYLIDFVVGEGEPTGNFDYKIPGLRGGTLRSRFEGELEGVLPETKRKVYDFAIKNNMSVHDFLELAINSQLGQYIE